jgi:hypothetical protein
MKNRAIQCAVILAAMAVLAACREETPYELNVPPTVDVITGADIAFKAIGGKGDIQVASVEGQLQATTDQSNWCHLTVSGNTIQVEVDEYGGLESRYAIVNMKAGNATGRTIVHQYGVIVKEYAWQDITVKNERQTLEFPYDANGSTVRISSDQDWVTFETTPEKLTVHVAPNPSTDYREALVHWNIGEVSGELTIGQFDLAAAGLLGDWEWHGKQQPNNRDFPMQATLSEVSDGVYTLAIRYTTSTVEIDMAVKDVILKANKLMLPLGNPVGTYTLKRTGVVYDAYPVVATGTTRIYYGNAVTDGSVPFILQKNEAGDWEAICDMSAYPDQFFRFEMWSQPADAYEEPHAGISSSGLILADAYMVKK